MKRPLAALAIFVALLRPLGHAAEPTEISPELGYLRVHSLVQQRAAIAAALHQPRDLILDLRFPDDERGAGEVLREELATPATPARLFVLVSPATPVPVVGAIVSSPVRLVTLGIKGAQPEPEVVVAQSTDEDGRAYAALAAGTPLANLISGKVEKEHYDEASLVEEFKAGNHDARPPEPAGNRAAATPSRLTDRVLQRAVHLWSALRALAHG